MEIIKVLSLVLLGLVLFALGIIFALLVIQCNHRNPTNVDIKDKTILEKYNKTRKLLNLIEGIFCIVMVLFWILNIISSDYIGFIVVAFFILNKIVEFIFKKKY